MMAVSYGRLLDADKYSFILQTLRCSSFADQYIPQCSSFHHDDGSGCENNIVNCLAIVANLCVLIQVICKCDDVARKHLVGNQLNELQLVWLLGNGGNTLGGPGNAASSTGHIIAYTNAVFWSSTGCSP